MQEEYTNNSVKEAYLRIFEKEKSIYEIDIWVPKEHQRNGIGTILLTQVSNDADKEGVTLYADPMPPTYYEDDGKRYQVPPDCHEKNREGLIKLYKRFRFEFPGGDEWGRWMIRKPGVREFKGV